MHLFIKGINKSNVVYHDDIIYLSVLLLNHFWEKNWKIIKIISATYASVIFSIVHYSYTGNL